MEKSKKVLLEVCGVLVFVAVICVAIVHNRTSVAAEVEKNFAQMDELNVEQALSSNPYDYIDNEYYESIVALGIPAVAVLEENYHNGTYSGVDGYIAALAIQDITGLNLYECTGNDWSTAEEFFEQWDATIQNLPDTFEKIVNSDASESDKIRQIEKYGVYGQEFLELQGSIIENDKMHGEESGGRTLEPLYIINKETYTFLHKRYPRMQFIPIFRSV